MYFDPFPLLTCLDRNKAETYSTFYCGSSNGQITIDLGAAKALTANGCAADCPQVKITSLLNPNYGGTYILRVVFYGDGSSTATVSFASTFTISDKLFNPAPAIDHLTGWVNQKTAIMFNFQVTFILFLFDFFNFAFFLRKILPKKCSSNERARTIYFLTYEDI